MNQVGKKGKGKSKKSKGQSKGKGPSQNQPQKGKRKSKGQSKGKQSQKEKVNGPHGQVNLGHGIRIKVKVGKVKEKDIKYVLIVVVKVIQSINAGGLRKLVLQGPVQIIRDRVYNISAQPGDHSVAVMPTDQLRGFQDLRPLHQQPHNQPYFSQPSSSSAVSSVFASGQGQGFSGHQLRINHFTSDVTEDYIMEVNFTNIPSMTSVHHCLKNVKNLGQHS